MLAFAHTDGADDEPHRSPLIREGVLDMGAHGRLPRVGPRLVIWHEPASRLPAVDPALLAEIRQIPLVRRRAVGCVGPHVGSRVPRVDQPFAQLRPVVGARVRHLLPADDAVPAVDRDVALVAERRYSDVHLGRAIRGGLGLGELHRPARIGVLLGRLGRRLGSDLVRRAAVLDRRLLAVRQPLKQK